MPSVYCPRNNTGRSFYLLAFLYLYKEVGITAIMRIKHFLLIYKYLLAYFKITALLVILAWLNFLVFTIGGIPVPPQYMCMLFMSHICVTTLLLIPEVSNSRVLRVINVLLNCFLSGVIPLMFLLLRNTDLDHTLN